MPTIDVQVEILSLSRLIATLGFAVTRTEVRDGVLVVTLEKRLETSQPSQPTQAS